MIQEMTDFLSLLMIEADLLLKINFDVAMQDFSRHKSIKNNLKLHKCILLSMKD